MLAGVARGEMGSKGGGDRMRLSDVDTWWDFKMSLILAADMVGVASRSL